MTATVTLDRDRREGWLRRLHDTLAKPHALLLGGKPVRLRLVQSVVWSAAAGVLGAAFVAGLYYLVLEQHWYIHIGSFNHGSSLKLWWDNGMGWIRSAAWPLYRHGIRDLGEPAVATVAVRTLLAKPKYWGVRVSTTRLVIAPVVLLAATIGMAVGGIWLLDFGGPDLWARLAAFALHPGYTLDGDFGWAGKVSLGNLALGFVIGQVLHRWWAPVGATLQGYALDRAVDRAQGGNLLGRTYIPLWVRAPLAPPVDRERFAKQYRENTDIQMCRSHRRATAIALALITLVTIVGLLAKFYIAHGHGVPYLAP